MNLVDLVASDGGGLLIFFQKLYSRTIKISKIDSRDEVNEALLMILLIARTVDTSTYKS